MRDFPRAGSICRSGRCTRGSVLRAIRTPDGSPPNCSRWRTDDESQAYIKSPIYYLRRSGDMRMRRRIDASTADEFPVLAELREAGMTDYAARIVRFEGVDAATP